MNISNQYIKITILFGLFCIIFNPMTTYAESIKRKVGIIAGLDKITAEITKIEIPVNGNKSFGSFTIHLKSCYTSPPVEPPHTTAFIEVDEREISGKITRIFSGWMFAESPGITAVEHPVYDVWLVECKDKLSAIPDETMDIEKLLRQ